MPMPNPENRSINSSLEFKVYNLQNLNQFPFLNRLSDEQVHSINVVGKVLFFRTNSYIVNELINWEDPNDPLLVLNFPQRQMLFPEHFSKMEKALQSGNDNLVRQVSNQIRWELNPHPAGQMELNIPSLADGTRLPGIQHKYDQTVLFFPAQGQTCHAYCTFCFRWPQFTNMKSIKFAMKRADLLIQYINEHPEITDVLFTGGDPLVMHTKILASYLKPILNAKIKHLKTIRFGTRVLSFWPYRFITDKDSDDLLELLKTIPEHGKHLAVMAHFNHYRELQTDAVRIAIDKLRLTGAEIRTQSPILRHINDSTDIWARMWQEQVNLGCVPYFMFAVRDTGAQHFFAIPLARGWRIFRKAMHQVSGIGRTLRGFSMSALPGKIQIVGIGSILNQEIFVLRFLQARKTDWAHKAFFAQYDDTATWIDDLKPAFGEEKFFYEKELEKMTDNCEIKQLNQQESLNDELSADY
jgi:KamA family protein